jgi:16S rRNA (uracil1498-N3)-methyltransferase
MNIILIEPQNVDRMHTRLIGAQARHVVKILRAKRGDNIRAGIVNGNLGKGTIVSMSARQPYSVDLRLDMPATPPPKLPIDIIVALPRPIVLRRVLKSIASLGVGSLYIINAGRVEKSYWDSTLIQQDTLRQWLIQGLELGGDTVLPEVELSRGFKDFVSNTLTPVATRYQNRLIAHPHGACQRTIHTGVPYSGRVLLAIGPEGGWLPYEVERFTSGGFDLFDMGDRILGVETAVSALCGMIMASHVQLKAGKYP